MSNNMFSRQRQQQRKKKLQRAQSGNARVSPESSPLRDLEIVSLSHEGRGIAKYKGKTQFVEGVLAGEIVSARLLQSHRNYDELKMEVLLAPSDDRNEPFCEHFARCGGCSMQNMSTGAQLKHKQAVLKEQFSHFGNVTVKHWLEPVSLASMHYRTKARLGVVYDNTLNQLIIGFREKQSKQLTPIEKCPILIESLSLLIVPIRNLILTLEGMKAVSHIELVGAQNTDALVIRHLKPFTVQDLERLAEFAETWKLKVFLQDKSGSAAKPLNHNDQLTYTLALRSLENAQENSLEISFHPQDFTQVNAQVNEYLVNLALEQLELNESDRVLDLFCGLGNFTLPIAKSCAEVIGVEGVEEMVQRARDNAARNKVDNVSFYATDLHIDFSQQTWAQSSFDKVLLDPPRAGALETVNYLSHLNAPRIVYISCNPATLARDAGVLVEHGYRLEKAGVIDMFPNTAHIESIAVFVKSK